MAGAGARRRLRRRSWQPLARSSSGYNNGDAGQRQVPPIDAWALGRGVAARQVAFLFEVGLASLLLPAAAPLRGCARREAARNSWRWRWPPPRARG